MDENTWDRNAPSVVFMELEVDFAMDLLMQKMLLVFAMLDFRERVKDGDVARIGIC